MKFRIFTISHSLLTFSVAVAMSLTPTAQADQFSDALEAAESEISSIILYSKNLRKDHCKRRSHDARHVSFLE